MKKYIIACALLLLIAGAVILYYTGADDASEGVLLPAPLSGDAITPHFTAYGGLGARTFHRFVREPSVEILNQAGGVVRVFSLLERPLGVFRVRPEVISPIGVHVPNPDLDRITLSFRVHEPFVRFAGDTGELQAFLAEYGITDEIESVAVVQSATGTRIISSDDEGRRVSNAPVVIWVQAGGESFFIGVEIHVDGFGDGYGTLVYRFYTHADYLELFEQRVRERTNWLGRLLWGFGY